MGRRDRPPIALAVAMDVIQRRRGGPPSPWSGEGGPEGRMGYGPLLIRRQACTSVEANCHRRPCSPHPIRRASPDTVPASRRRGAQPPDFSKNKVLGPRRGRPHRARPRPPTLLPLRRSHGRRGGRGGDRTPLARPKPSAGRSARKASLRRSKPRSVVRSRRSSADPSPGPTERMGRRDRPPHRPCRYDGRYPTPAGGRVHCHRNHVANALFLSSCAPLLRRPSAIFFSAND